MPESATEELARAKNDFDHFLSLSVEDRLKNAFPVVYRPVLDDGPPLRSWNTMEEYCSWCEDNLPVWLGLCSPQRLSEVVSEIESKNAE